MRPFLSNFSLPIKFCQKCAFLIWILCTGILFLVYAQETATLENAILANPNIERATLDTIVSPLEPNVRVLLAEQVTADDSSFLTFTIEGAHSGYGDYAYSGSSMFADTEQKTRANSLMDIVNSRVPLLGQAPATDTTTTDNDENREGSNLPLTFPTIPVPDTANNKPLFSTPLSLTWQLQAKEDLIYSEGNALGHTLTFTTPENIIKWEGKSYRGELQIVAVADKLLVLNIVSLEDYVQGVVPAEMYTSWPLEALKAQAVAVRSYTLNKLNPEAMFDICATHHCQAYGGLEGEHPRSNEAIQNTRGMILTYAHRPAMTYYHADAGGTTASSQEVWDEDVPYLASKNEIPTVSAELANSSPHRQWQVKLEPELISNSIAEHQLGTINHIDIVGHSDSGRVSEISIVGSKSSLILAGPELHTLLREWGLKSTKFVMKDAFTVQGDGWGHGVGMSQFGAMALAKNNYRYEDILAFYYPKTQLQRLP